MGDGHFQQFSDDLQDDPFDASIMRGYWLAKYPITQAHWESLMPSNPSLFRSQESPVDQVSWFEAIEFIDRLNSVLRDSRPLGHVFGLPYEIQWEYACVANTTTRFNTGDTEDDLDRAGWYLENSARTSHDVGAKSPNNWGFHDMHGNVYEWCQDWAGDYPREATADWQGPAVGTDRILRGGSWATSIVAVYRPFGLALSVCSG